MISRRILTTLALQGEIFVSAPKDEKSIVMNFVLNQPKSTMCNTDMCPKKLKTILVRIIL
jgi:hypothetical protein